MTGNGRRWLVFVLLFCGPTVVYSTDGPYQPPAKKKPKAKVMAPAPVPSPTPEPAAPFDGDPPIPSDEEILEMDAARRAAFEEPVPTPTPEPTPEPPAVRVVAAAGGVVPMGGGASSSLQPLALVLVDLPVSDAQMGPHVVPDLMLGALPGGALSLTDPTTFRTLTFRALLAQPLSKRLRFTPYFGVGFTTRLGTDTEPLDRTARWWSAGIRFAGARGLLELGGGMDERLGGGYAPTGHVRGALLMGSTGGINAYLYGEGILALRLGYWSADRVDVVLVGVGAGR